MILSGIEATRFGSLFLFPDEFGPHPLFCEAPGLPIDIDAASTAIIPL